MSEVVLIDPVTRFISLSHSYGGAEGEPITEFRFAEQLVAGTRLDLYRLDVDRSEINRAYLNLPHVVYYAGNGAELQKLEVIESLSSQGHLRFQLLERYKGVLAYMMADWPQASSRIESTRFEEKELARLVTSYNQAIGAEVPYSIISSKEKRLALRHAVAVYTPTLFYQETTLPFRGVGLDYVLKLRQVTDNSRWEVAFGAGYLRSQYDREVSAGIQTITASEYRLLTELNYFPFGHRTFSPYLIGGATSYHRTAEANDKRASSTRGQSMNLNVGFGIRYGRLEVFGRRENRIFSVSSFRRIFSGLDRQYLTTGISYAFRQ
ncbi:hypothetical protein [Neolewinella sp.]|uniref:hypothetical protein n=1 Tax=Neolewinella sp. TaxID=2993543 RepID=UPI003B51E6CA